jgi:hypothetical protein
MRESIAAALTTFGLLVTAAPASAHHSSAAAYDSTKTTEIQGTITKVLLKNPHTFVFVEAADEKGQKVVWAVEMGASSNLFTAGWTKDMLVPGTVVKVSGIPSRAAGSHGITTATFTKADGTPIGPKGPPSRD